MAVNIHSKAFETDFEVSERIEPLGVDLTAVRLKDGKSRKEGLKFTLSVTYFAVLVYFLSQLIV